MTVHDAVLREMGRLLTHTLTLDEINEGFDRLARGEAVRQVVLL